jgi:hypothetical protein
VRRSRNQNNRNISRKDAKAAKKKKQYFLSELGVLRALAGGISESEMFMYRKFAQAAKIFKHSSAKDAE